MRRLRFRALERLDHFIHLRRWSWWVPAPIHVWICDRFEGAIWRQFPEAD